MPMKEFALFAHEGLGKIACGNRAKLRRPKTLLCVVGQFNERSDLRENGAFDFPLNRQRELRAD